MKSDRTLSSSAWKNISQLWQKRERLQRRTGVISARRQGLRLEFLEGRDMMHAGEYDPTTAFHIHAQLDIFVNGVAQVIPQGIGDHVPGEASPTVHTHAADGQVHMHYAAGVRAANDFVKLDEFFDRWRRDTTLGNANAVFSSTNILGNNVDATHTIRFYVNGELNTDFQNYQVHDKDNIVISYEPLTTADAPTILPMKDVTVLAGSPLYIPLNGFDTGTGALTFTASSSNSNVVTTYIPQNNSTLKISVADYGDMYFQLFDDKAARPAQRVETLANQGFYNGVIFHRVVNNFVIQGGDPTGTGSGGSQLGNFDDQFNVDLQHNRTGLLSFAKTTDDTNNSQFFITEGPQRHLDFNHSVFGMLIGGENVRELISEAATGSNNRPTTNIVMSSVQVVADTKNNVLMLKAPQGTTGASDVTVTVTDATGNIFEQTFHVTVTPDTTNGGPFLNDIQPVHVLAGQTSTFQLTSQDAEGNPVNYAIEKQGTQTNYSLSVNPTSGVVTITPPVGFTGTLQAKATLTPTTPTDTGDTSDIQVFSITVDANRVPTVDLDAASDTGVSQTDNVTKATTLVFNLSDVQAGDTVRLFDGATQVGEQVAAGSTVAITVNTVTAGVHSYTSRTVVNGVVSSASTALAVTVDTTPPLAINTVAPTRATATELYSYDAGHPDETLGLVRYSVAGATPQDPAPAGLAVNDETGLVTWTPTALQTGAQAFTLIATDPAGNTATQLVNLTVNPFVAAQAEIAIDFLDANGNPITSIAQGGEFFVRAQVRDLNGAPAGISTFETDVTYDSTKVTTTTGNFVFGLGSNFNALTGGNKTTPGLLDEVGALDGTFTRSNSPDFFELFRIKLKATGTGPVLFQTDPAENGRVQISTFASPNPLDLLAVRFGSATLTIQSSFTAVADLFSVQEESSANSLDVLLNDTSLPGTTNVLTIVSVGNKSPGTTIEVSPDGKRVLYTPAANFVGQDTFTYLVTNQNNETNTATVTVNVSNQNDPPTAVADTATVAEDSTTTLPVMGNDSSAPDVGETLRIDSLGTPSNGGTVSIAAGNAGVVYKPAANFFGTETFTYTINDGFGGLATATVTVTVTPTNDNPTAADDSLSIAEDSTAVTINVLSNDNSQPDGPETLTVTAVGTGSKGGTITLTDGVVRYAPALNFFGEETFTYTISDGNGGTATAAVRVNVVNANDPPVGVADTVTGFKNTTDFAFNNLLANDTSGVDPTENLVIASVAAGSQGGQLKVSTDGKGVLYTPARDFVGAETFVYTLRDPGGLTATATVTVNVQNFVPSTFSGAVFEDSNGNGIRDTNEAALSNVLITLTGKDTSNQSVSLTTRSLNDGSYKFSNLAPGTYTITESQPQFKDDGVEKLGNAGGTAGEDNFTITLAENTSATGYNFTEKGTPTKNVLVTDIFARRQRNFVSAAVSPTGSSFSQVAGTAWQAYDSTQLSLNSAGDQLTILATDHSSQQYSVTIPLSDTSRIQERGSENGQMYLRLLANPSDLNFVKVGGGTSTNAPVITTTASAIAYTENTSLVIDDGLLLSDPDSSTLSSATVGISTNYFRDSDFLEFTNQAGITGSFNSTTGTLTLQGAASVSAYQAALRTVKFRISATLPSTAGRTITFSASDGANTSASATRLVTVTTVNDAPVATTSSGTTSYTTGAAGVAIDNGLTVTDVDSPVLSGATVSITTGFQVGQDQLDFTTQNGITGNYNQSTGQLVLTGNSTVANYQTALRSVTYRTTNASANLFTRNVAFIVNDGSASNAQSAIASKQITVTGQPNVFTINASALNGASVGAVTATQATTGALVYELNNSTQDAKLSLRPGDHLSGNLNGSIILVEYIDLQCPVCRDYYPVLEAMKQQFGDDLLIVQRHFPIEPNHPLARAAARAAEAAHKQGKFKEMVDLMFTRQSVWSPLQNSSAAADPTATFESYATELGLNLTQFRADSAVGVADALIDSDKADAIALGGTGAPTMFLNGGSKITLPGATNAAFAALLQPVKDGLTNIFNINHTTGQLTLRNRSALNPATTPTLQVPVRITDSAGVSQVVQVTVNVTANSSPVVTLSAGNSSFSEGSSAAPVDALLTVADSDSTNLVSATVTIATGYQASKDSLTFVTQNGITGDFNAGTGVLTLTGSSTIANYQAALRSIGFNNLSQAPTAGTRTLQIVVNDGTTASTLVTKSLGVTSLNDAPVLTPTATALAYLENAGPVIVDAGLAVVDVDSANLTGATVSISAGHSGSEDELLFDTQNGITGLYNGLSGQLSLTGTSSVENYQTALRSIRYRNNSENPTVTSRTIRFVVGDGGNENNTSAEVTRVINLTAVNDAPLLATTSSGPLTYTAATAATVIDPLISVNDSELDNFTGGKVTISAGFVTGADVLAVTNMHGITGTFNTTTGELTLTGNATVSQYQELLRTVTFHNAAAFGASSRTITFQLTDAGSPAGVSNDLTRNITVESGGTAEGEGFFASLGEELPEGDDNTDLSQDDFTSNIDEFYTLVGE